MKTLIKTFLLCLLLAAHTQVSNAQETPKKVTELLLLGTFHFNNPGLDMVKTKSFDILSEKAQNELEHITDKIKEQEFTKIFVEYPYENQQKLDSLYNSYLAGNKFDDPNLAGYYRKGEIFQLAFRAAKKLGHKKVFAVDYINTDFPGDSLMNVLATNNQQNLQEEIMNLLKKIGEETNARIEAGATLAELILHENKPETMNMNINTYSQLFTRAGALDNFVGAYLTSEWYRRNIYIWSLIQKQLEPQDTKVMVLFGAGHTANLHQILQTHGNLKIIPLKDILN